MTNGRFTVFLAFVLIAASLAIGCAKDPDDEDATINGNAPGGSDTTGGGDDDSDDDTADDDTDDDTGDDDQVTVAVVFQSSVLANNVYNILFDEVGWIGYNVLLTDLIETSFDSADVILVDAYTTWQDSAVASFVADTGLPILGMGSGGLQLFEMMGLNADLEATNGIVYDFEDSFTVTDPQHPVFNEPYDFAAVLAETDSLDVMNTSTDLFGVNLDPLPTGVSVIATREFDETRGGILLEDSKYMSWGLDLSAEQLNQNGSALLINCLFYLTD